MIHALVRSGRPRLRRSAAALTAVAVGVGLVVAGTAPAFAGTSTNGTTLTGTTTLAHLSASDTWGSLSGTASADMSMNWSQVASVQVDWTDNLVRQGRSLDPTVTYARPAPGSMSITYSVSASLSWDSFVSIGVSASITASGPCDLRAGGSDYVCHLTSDDIGVLDPGLLALGAPYVDAAVTADVTVTPQQIDTLRTATFAGTPAGSSTLHLQESPITDPLAVPCSAGVGDDLGYQLGTLSTSDALSVATGIDFKVGAIVPNPITGVPGIRVQFTDQNVPLGTTPGSIDMSGAGTSADFGAIQANNIAPTVSVAPSFTGDEGSPITFSATATGPCAAGGSYKWSFSDGGHEYGAVVHHTFTDSGPYTGTVKITDTTGLTDSADFAVTVNNLPPNVAVVPSAPTIAWGRPLTVQAQAVDPGTGDQPYLTYAWDFADSTPIVTGGATQTHQWALPGFYSASVQVCDNDGGCTTVPFTVTVRKRDTSIGYTGDTAGTYSATASLAGSLVDEYGQAVNGAQLDFALDGTAVGSALTDATGHANRIVPVGLLAGAHNASAAFAGNALYTASGPASSAFPVSTMGTTLVYTGSLSGSPNKSTPLSARLTDLLGRPLAGRTITFVLGSQTITAVTNTSGVASVSLVLNQKPNRYPLTVSWPGESGKYDPSSQSVSFSLNKK
jgi:hypothetical protein